MRPEQLTIQARIERQVRALMVLNRRWPTYESDPVNGTRAIIQAAAVALGVERASIWLLEDDDTALVCRDLYEAGPHRHSRGFKISEREAPAYFAALQSEGWIVASDAHQDPRTAAFAANYLAPHGVGAILDMPIRTGGELAGILRHEHVGGTRVFQTDEQLTAAHLATLASLALEVQRGARLAEERAAALSMFDAGMAACGAEVVVQGLRGEIVRNGSGAAALWRLDPALFEPGADPNRRTEAVAAQTKDPARFIARLRRISADLADDSHDVIELRDGRRLERRSVPQWRDGTVVGRVWSFREL